MKFKIQALLALSLGACLNLVAERDIQQIPLPPMGLICWSDQVTFNSPHVTEENRNAVLLSLEHLNHSIAIKRGSYGCKSTPIDFCPLEKALLKGKKGYGNFDSKKRTKNNEIFNLEIKLGTPHFPQKLISSVDMQPEVNSDYMTPENRPAFMAGLQQMNLSLTLASWYGPDDHAITAIDSVNIAPLADAIMQAHKDATKKYESTMKKKEEYKQHLEAKLKKPKLVAWWATPALTVAAGAALIKAKFFSR